MQEHEPQQDVLPDELEPLVAPVSDNNIDSETSIISILSISSKMFFKSKFSFIIEHLLVFCLLELKSD